MTTPIEPASDRREFLRHAVLVGAGLLWGCGGDDGGSGTDAGPAADSATATGTDAGPDTVTADTGPACDNPFAGSELLGTLDFVQEGGKPIAKKYGVGWDGRYYTDLSGLAADSLVTATEHFYVRTAYPDLLDPAKPWKILVDGPGKSAVSLTMASLEPLAKDMGVHLMECSGNGPGGRFGLISAARWTGIPVATVLAEVGLAAGATRLEIAGFDGHSKPSANNHSKPGASWIFTPKQLSDAGAFFATGMNGAPLTPDHGFPVRLVVPGWYGCCDIKWVDRISAVGEGAKASAQMKEFASRTHQVGVPAMAADYLPATIDQAAMPVRVERRRLADGGEALRIVGVMWGGYALTDALTIRIGAAAPAQVTVCPAQHSNATWTLWEHLWAPSKAGSYPITMHIDDPKVPTRRLDKGWYKRVVQVV